jgi:transposase
MRPIGTTKQLEQRRRKAISLLEQGHGVRQTARLVGVTGGAVTQWRKAYETHGEKAFQAHSPPGRKPRLSEKKTRQLEKLLLKGARKNGYSTELWTLKRVGEIIYRRFGVRYEQSSIWHVLKRMGWSCQKPERRARERDEQAVATWRKTDWPRIKKSPKKRQNPCFAG